MLQTAPINLDEKGQQQTTASRSLKVPCVLATAAAYRLPRRVLCPLVQEFSSFGEWFVDASNIEPTKRQPRDYRQGTHSQQATHRTRQNKASLNESMQKKILGSTKTQQRNTAKSGFVPDEL